MIFHGLQNFMLKVDPYADVDGVGGGVWVNFHRRRRHAMIFSRRRRRHKKDRRSAAVDHLQEVYKNTIWW